MGAVNTIRKKKNYVKVQQALKSMIRDMDRDIQANHWLIASKLESKYRHFKSGMKMNTKEKKAESAKAQQEFEDFCKDFDFDE